MATFHNGVQLSPFICAKARFALNLKPRTRNDKRCSSQYWERVVRRIAQLEQRVDEVRIQNAINRYDEIFNNN